MTVLGILWICTNILKPWRAQTSDKSFGPNLLLNDMEIDKLKPHETLEQGTQGINMDIEAVLHGTYELEAIDIPPSELAVSTDRNARIHGITIAQQWQRGEMQA